MHLRLVVMVLAAITFVFNVAPVHAQGACIAVGWDGANADCEWSYSEYVQASGSEDEHTWVVSIQCGNGGICTEQVECAQGDESGFMHDVYMNGADVGDVCVPTDKVDQVSIAQLIIREFKRIEWPASKLVVQPKGGRTLVNLRTNFFTPDHRSIDQTVTVADQSVEILAMPVTYTYAFGDGSSHKTASPGSPYPNLDVTHVYERTGTVAVRVDTTYAGEYRIGDGAWVSIADTLTVTGTSQDLEIVEALPQLVLE